MYMRICNVRNLYSRMQIIVSESLRAVKGNRLVYVWLHMYIKAYIHLCIHACQHT